MNYIIYLNTIFNLYIMIRYMHGTYISYCFVKWILGGIYSGFLFTFSVIIKPKQQIEDMKVYFRDEGEYLIIN